LKRRKNILSQKKVKGFNVLMIERGRKVKANLKPLPKIEAVRLGRDIADNSLSASYKITQSKVTVPQARRSKLATGGFVNPIKFRKGRTGKTFGFGVEKRTFRIDSRGEKQGLTAAKLISQRKRQFFDFSGKFKQSRSKKNRILGF